MAEKKDVPMNTFPQVTDAEYIYAEAADGSQVKIKTRDLAGVINLMVGGIFQVPFETRPLGNTKGFIIKTSIVASQYRAVRLQCSIGFNQNGAGNENFSVNVKYWNNAFNGGFLSRENYLVSICNYVICYIDDDNTFSFYLNSLYTNSSGGYLLLLAMSNTNYNKNQIISMTETSAEYVIGSHEKEIKITIT